MFSSGNFCNFPIDELRMGTSSDILHSSIATSNSLSESFQPSCDSFDFPVCPHAHNFECLDEVHHNVLDADLCDVTFLVGPTLQPNYGLRAVMSSKSVVLHCLLEKHALLFNKDSHLRSKNKTIGCFSKIFRRTKNRKSINRSKLVISLSEHDPVFFATFLTYIHTGQANINVSNLAGLLHLADLYNVKDLLNVCETFAKTCVTSHTAIVLLASSQKYSHCQAVCHLITKVLNFIDQHAVTVLTSKEFIRASPSIATQILSRAQLNLSTNDRVSAMFSWAKRHHRGDTTDLPVTLNGLLEYVDFNRVTSRKLRRDITVVGYVPPMPAVDQSYNNRHHRRIVRRELFSSNRVPRQNKLISLVQSQSSSIYSTTEAESGFNSFQ